MKKTILLIMALILLVGLSANAMASEGNYTVNMTIDTTLNADVQIQYPTIVNINISCGHNATSCDLHRNVTGGGTIVVAVGVRNATNNTQLAAGDWLFTGNHSDNKTGANFTLTVTKATGNSSLDIDPDSGITYNTSMIANCSSTDEDEGGRAVYYRNGTDVTSTENNTYAFLSGGNHKLNCTNRGADANYTYSESVIIYTVNKETVDLELTLNGLKSNVIEYIDFTVDIFCNVTEENATLYDNSTKVVSNVTSVNITRSFTARSFHTYLCELDGINYTATSATYYVNSTTPDALRVTGAARTIMVNILTVILALAALIFVATPFLNGKYEQMGAEEWIRHFFLVLIYVIFIIILLNAVYTIP